MPTLLLESGFRFSFFSAEPIYKTPHIHVEKSGARAVFLLEPIVALERNQGMKVSDIAKAKRIVLKYQKEFLEKYYAVVKPKHRYS